MEPKMEIDRKGNKFWRLHGRLHREDGPAAEWAGGTKQWYLNGKFHRIDGPALECMDGSTQWWLYNRPLTFDEWLDQNHKLTDGEKVMMKLKYG
jgi:hypothetical protein